MNNNEFLLIPVILCLILFILAELKIILFQKNIFYWVLTIIAGIVSGLRVDVGRDYSIYKSFFSGGIPVNVSEFLFLKFAEKKFNKRIDNKINPKLNNNLIIKL